MTVLAGKPQGTLEGKRGRERREEGVMGLAANDCNEFIVFFFIKIIIISIKTLNFAPDD